MMEFLVGCSVLLLLAMGTIQLSLLWSGQGAVETAAHFAARKFALHARTDFRKAKAVALAEASSIWATDSGGDGGRRTSRPSTFPGRERETLSNPPGRAKRSACTSPIGSNCAYPGSTGSCMQSRL